MHISLKLLKLDVVYKIINLVSSGVYIYIYINDIDEDETQKGDGVSEFLQPGTGRGNLTN